MVDLKGRMKASGKGLPHRYPFLMVDRVKELEPGQRAVAQKVISIDDLFLTGHFPGGPCMPENIILEALAQTGGIALLSATEGGMGTLVKVEEMKFSNTPRPGVQIELFAEVEFRFGGMAKVKVRAEAQGKTVAQGVLILAGGRSDR